MNNLFARVGLSIVGTLLLTACGGGSKSGPGGGPKMCAPETSTCTAAQTNAYATCVQDACDSQYKTCLGPNYKSGTFSGPCAEFITCQNACACNDTVCASACPITDTACVTCLLGVSSCSMTCTPPACFSGGGTGGSSGGGTGGSSGGGTGGSSGGGATCADLLACCNAAADASFKMACMQQYTGVMAMGDAVCAQVLALAKPLYCP